MRTVFARIGNAVLLLAFVGLLGWGGLQAHSADAALTGNAVAADHCLGDVEGHCTDDEECNIACQEAGHEFGHCSDTRDCGICFD